MRAEFEKSAIIQHSPSKGTTREVLILERYLKQYLPGNVRVSGSSEIIATSGERSRQCDIVIHDIAAPPLYDEFGYRILPAECVYAVIEVKSKLNSAELRSAVEHIAQVKRLPKAAFYQQAPLQRTKTQYGKRFPYCPTAGFIFAYGSVRLNTLAKNLRELLKDYCLEERLDAAWILGSGSFNWMTPTKTILPTPEPGAWLSMGFNPPDQDVVLNMTMILNSHLTHAFMPPFRLLDYAQHTPMLQNVSAWDIDKS